MTAYRLGAVFYVAWGLLHLPIGYMVSGIADGLGGGMDVEAARITQNAWHIAMMGAFALVIGAKWNWRNDARGYWLNLALVSGVEFIFIGVILIPGHVPLTIGLVGPILWLLATVFSTLGYRAREVVAAAAGDV